MTIEAPRIIYLAHQSPGRLRFRLNWLRERRDAGAEIADALAQLDGVIEVKVRPFTGSVLVVYDPAAVDDAAIREALLVATDVTGVTLPGHETPEQIQQILHGSYHKGSELSHVVVKAFQGINVDLLRVSGGHVSLGTAMALALWAGAAAKIVANASMPLPDWHQMLWWGFRSFGTLESEAIQTARERPIEELYSPNDDSDADDQS
jgi:copper chaperone CopZ